ncbi:MAG: F0F1 ATP synthase subunit gamma [bacterium]|jgi:ATP synthase F1 gamma subunit
MALLSQLRRDLRFNTEFLQLIVTLKNIAASQYHTMEREKERFSDFMDQFAGFFRVVDMVHVDAPLVSVATDVIGVVLVTSDSGFMGGLNAGVIDAGYDVQGNLPPEKISFIVIGERGIAKLAEKGREFKAFPGINQETRFEQALEIRDYIVNEVKEKRIGKVVVVHPRALSFTQQTVDTVPILPCGELFDKSSDSEITRRTGVMKQITDARKVTVESSYPDMVEYLAGMWVASKLFEVFEDSKLAEFAARAMHLEDSSQKLTGELKKLKHQCFRAAHELVDKSMRESFSSRKKKKKVA